MKLTLPNLTKIEVRSFEDASKKYLAYCNNNKVKDFSEEAGELHGGQKNFLVGKVDSQGNVWDGQLWPNAKKIFDNQNK